MEYSEIKVAQNRFLDDILINNPGAIWPEKNGKNSKNRFLGPMFLS